MSARPPASTEHVRLRFSTQKRKDTTPELQLRRLLHHAGMRYRVGLAVPGAPRRSIDIAFTRVKVAVFVDGCFWHGCPDHGVAPKANSEWWAEKLKANRERDASTDALLRSAGWKVIRIWEHASSVEAAHFVQEAVRQQGNRVP